MADELTFREAAEVTFQDEVTEMLLRALGGVTLAEGCNMSPNDHVRRLAPRIALAIAAAAAAADSEDVDSWKWSREAALKALQGRDA